SVRKYRIRRRSRHARAVTRQTRSTKAHGYKNTARSRRYLAGSWLSPGAEWLPVPRGRREEIVMSVLEHRALSRRGFCLCCAGAAGLMAAGGWLNPSQAYAKARSIVDLIRDDAAKAPIKVHKLHHNISILEGSGGNIAVLTGSDGKVFVDAGITASRPRILEAANGLGPEPIRHLINTHWHFDHADGNAWLNAEGAEIIAHEKTHKHLMSAQRVEDWDFDFTPS